MTAADHTLWIEPLAPRFFRAAPGALPSPGLTWLVALDGTAVQADLAADPATWSAGILTETEARDRYRAAVRAAAEGLPQALQAARSQWARQQPGLAAVVARLAAAQRAEDRAGAADAAPAGAGDEVPPVAGDEVVALWLGRSRAELRADPAAAAADLEAALADLRQQGAAAAGSRPTSAPTEGPLAAVPPPVWAALVAVLDRWWWGEFETARLGDAAPTEVLAVAGRLLAELAEDPLRDDVRARRLQALRAEARAAIARDTAGWRPPNLSFADLLRPAGSTSGSEP